MRDIILYNYDPVPEVFKDFEDSIISGRLKHLATDLALLGIDDPDEISEAIEKAIEVCKMAGVSVAENFRPVYFCKNNKIFRDWRLSDLAMKLTIINAGVEHEIVCLTQVNLVKG